MDEANAKRALIDIVRYAYRDSPKLNEYCDFRYEIVNKEMKSKHGDYTGALRRIRIFNTESRSLTHLIKTSIHELAHHIDHCNRGKSDHSKDFYKEYRLLLFAALDLGLLDLTDALEGARDSTDANKMKLILVEYMELGRAKRDRIKRAARISVYNAYDIKGPLKAMGFRWDPESKAWAKELDEHAEGDIRRVEELISVSGKNIRYELEEPVSFDSPPALPDKSCYHEFTEEERKRLLAGDEIYVEKCWSKKRALFFSCYLAWNGTELISRIGDD